MNWQSFQNSVTQIAIHFLLNFLRITFKPLRFKRPPIVHQKEQSFRFYRIKIQQFSSIREQSIERRVASFANRKFRRIFAHSRFYLSARFLRPQTSFDRLSCHIYSLIENFKGYPMNLYLSECRLSMIA